jgi:hypothetical protein
MMSLIKKTALLCMLSAVTFPAIAADINIINHTDSSGTGYVNNSPCSSQLGNRGILQPHSTLTVPLSIIKLFCLGSTCEAHFYTTKDCSGKEIGSGTIDPNKGVTSVTNNDKAHYTVSWNATEVTIDPVPGTWKDWFKSLLS